MANWLHYTLLTNSLARIISWVEWVDKNDDLFYMLKALHYTLLTNSLDRVTEKDPYGVPKLYLDELEAMAAVADELPECAWAKVTLHSVN